jgi:hypothetical protein
MHHVWLPRFGRHAFRATTIGPTIVAVAWLVAGCQRIIDASERCELTSDCPRGQTCQATACRGAASNGREMLDASVQDDRGERANAGDGAAPSGSGSAGERSGGAEPRAGMGIDEPSMTSGGSAAPKAGGPAPSGLDGSVAGSSSASPMPSGRNEAMLGSACTGDLEGCDGVGSRQKLRCDGAHAHNAEPASAI